MPDSVRARASTVKPMAGADVIVWDNPRCSRCRRAEQLLAAHGVPAQRVFYLDNPPPRAEITRVLALL
jgi:arsenate reductase-like glutaredoxin family protein